MPFPAPGSYIRSWPCAVIGTHSERSGGSLSNYQQWEPLIAVDKSNQSVYVFKKSNKRSIRPFLVSQVPYMWKQLSITICGSWVTNRLYHLQLCVSSTREVGGNTTGQVYNVTNYKIKTVFTILLSAGAPPAILIHHKNKISPVHMYLRCRRYNNYFTRFYMYAQLQGQVNMAQWIISGVGCTKVSLLSGRQLSWCALNGGVLLKTKSSIASFYRLFNASKINSTVDIELYILIIITLLTFH